MNKNYKERYGIVRVDIPLHLHLALQHGRSWNHATITDFATFKPLMLPQDVRCRAWFREGACLYLRIHLLTFASIYPSNYLSL